jgi:hypothetical protein
VERRNRTSNRHRRRNNRNRSDTNETAAPAAVFLAAEDEKN